MSRSKSSLTKILTSFRITPDTIEKIEALIQEDPSVYTKARIVDTALYLFLELSNEKKKRAIKEYLLKDF